MARTKQKTPLRQARTAPSPPVPARLPSLPEKWRAPALFLFLTLCVTFPLVLSPASSIYSPTDHISTDVYATMAITLWWPKYAIWNLGQSLLRTPMLCAPYSYFLSTSFLIGWFALPVTLLTSPVFTNNLLTWAGYFLSALSAYLLVHHLTRNRLASALSGVVFAFCPYMLLRGYTTYDTIQVQWLPLYILALLKFDEERSWKNAGWLAGSLLGAILLSLFYYFVFFPILTGAYLIVRLVAYHRTRKERVQSPESRVQSQELETQDSGLRASWLSGLISRQDLVKLTAVGAVVAGAFVLHYKLDIQPPPDLPKVESGLPMRRSVDQLWELRMAVKDYFVPVQQSAVFGGAVKDYWQEIYQTERRNSINSAAYVGYVALILAAYALYRRRDWKTAFFALFGLLALLATLGPYPFTPAWLMFQYAPFVRRINFYKVYVQLAVAVLAGIGLSLFLERFKARKQQVIATGGLIALSCLEYTITPPLIHTDVSWIPRPYTWLSQVSGDPIVMEYPMRKAWGADYQGYYYYQMWHRKRLFNGLVSHSFVPLQYRPFWEDMEVPAAIADENNQAVLRHFGVKYILKHYRVQSQKAILRSLPQPDFDGLAGLKLAYPSPDFRREYRDFSPAFVWENMGRIVTNPGILDHPHDYVWTDIYEVVAGPTAVLLTWDYRSPYPTSAEASEYFAVNLASREKNFYPPTLMFSDNGRWTAITQIDLAQSLREQAATQKLPLDLRAWRMMKNDGRMEALNLTDRGQAFDLLFDALSFETPRRVEVWAGDRKLTDLVVGTQPAPFTLKDLRLEPKDQEGQKLTLRFHALEGPVKVVDEQGGSREATVAFHNFRVVSQR